jgi:hypothetical protein
MTRGGDWGKSLPALSITVSPNSTNRKKLDHPFSRRWRLWEATTQKCEPSDRLRMTSKDSTPQTILRWSHHPYSASPLNPAHPACKPTARRPRGQNAGITSVVSASRPWVQMTRRGDFAIRPKPDTSDTRPNAEEVGPGRSSNTRPVGSREPPRSQGILVEYRKCRLSDDRPSREMPPS